MTVAESVPDLHPAEARIALLGISRPEDIDIDAIAWDAGVEVKYAALGGCEATLVGYESRGIATIRKDAVRVRQRFSVGHELGHWHYHRGHSFRCRVDDPSENFAPDRIMEKEADIYSSHLLLPSQLFRPRIKALPQPNFTKLQEIAKEFEASVIATALRVTSSNVAPAILTCHRGDHLRWFDFASDVPKRWYLKNVVDSDTFAYAAIHTGNVEQGFRKASADSWFTNDDAYKYEVLEHSLVRGPEVLTLLLLGQEMLGARYDPGAFMRKFNATGDYIPRKGLKR
jgi:hypothetical protein